MTASLSPATNEAEEALQRELKRLEAIEALKVDAPWPVWIKLYDQEVHNNYFVNTGTGEATYELPVPTDSTFEQEITRQARALPEEIAKGPPDVYTRHISALKIQTCVARRRSALYSRGGSVSQNDEDKWWGRRQSWVECFDPVSCRLYYWKCGAIESTEIAWDTPPEELVDLRRRIIRSVDPQSSRFYYHSAPLSQDT